MLRVTIELVPHGNEARKRTIGVMHIANDGTNKERGFGNYNVTEMSDIDGITTWVAKNVERLPIFDFLALLASFRPH